MSITRVVWSPCARSHSTLRSLKSKTSCPTKTVRACKIWPPKKGTFVLMPNLGTVLTSSRLLKSDVTYLDGSGAKAENKGEDMTEADANKLFRYSQVYHH